MKKLAFALVLFAAGIAVGLLLRGKSVTAQASGLAPRPIGDINNDSRLDIADAVYLLNYLFGGPEGQGPAPIAGLLPSTGQVKCTGEDRKSVDCDGSICPGQDGFYSSGCPMHGRFEANPDGTVLDKCTGLMWQRESSDVTGDGNINAGDRVSWCQALSYCENLTFAGHDDWRLPNVHELMSLLDFGREDGILLIPAFRISGFRTWTSTPARDGDAAYYVDFETGFDGAESKQFGGLSVRAVRNQ